MKNPDHLIIKDCTVRNTSDIGCCFAATKVADTFLYIFSYLISLMKRAKDLLGGNGQPWWGLPVHLNTTKVP